MTRWKHVRVASLPAPPPREARWAKQSALGSAYDTDAVLESLPARRHAVQHSFELGLNRLTDWLAGWLAANWRTARTLFGSPANDPAGPISPRKLRKPLNRCCSRTLTVRQSGWAIPAQHPASATAPHQHQHQHQPAPEVMRAAMLHDVWPQRRRGPSRPSPGQSAWPGHRRARCTVACRSTNACIEQAASKPVSCRAPPPDRTSAGRLPVSRWDSSTRPANRVELSRAGYFQRGALPCCPGQRPLACAHPDMRRW